RRQGGAGRGARCRDGGPPDHGAGGAHDRRSAACHHLRDAARRARCAGGARRARAQQAVSARRDRPSRQPEIRARDQVPDRRALRRSRAHREAVAIAASPARPATADRGRQQLRRRGRRALNDGRPEAADGPPRRKREKRDVNGWLVLDKPVGMASTHAVAVAKRVFQAKRAGHAGTLDPLASGLLPIALGEATKTVPFVMEGSKVYHFIVRWGEKRDTDDAEGRVSAVSAERPGAEAIRALLARFTGRIEQVPPRF